MIEARINKIPFWIGENYGLKSKECKLLRDDLDEGYAPDYYYYYIVYYGIIDHERG